MYDTIIIGAGIAGATLAYTLAQKNQNILVLEKQGIATGGSGAAGAFISPKLGQTSSLHTLTNEAFEYAKDFYAHTCPHYFHPTGILRIPKDKADAQKLLQYQSIISSPSLTYSKEMLLELGVTAGLDSLFFSEAGDCDAKEVCEHLLKEIDLIHYDVQEIRQEKGLWQIGEYSAKNIVLCTGHESLLFDIDYMGIRATWGSRGDFSTKLELDFSMHQSLSVSSKRNGFIKLGATHEKSVKVPQKCKIKEVLSLEKKASKLIDTSDFSLIQSYCGMRAGSKDYVPLIGKIIDVQMMLEQYPMLRKGKVFPLQYQKNVYIMNGLGGRGFVFAPILAKALAEYIVEGTDISDAVNADRLFYKWCRKLNNQTKG